MRDAVTRGSGERWRETVPLVASGRGTEGSGAGRGELGYLECRRFGKVVCRATERKEIGPWSGNPGAEVFLGGNGLSILIESKLAGRFKGNGEIDLGFD